MGCERNVDADNMEWDLHGNCNKMIIRTGWDTITCTQ